MSSKVSFTIRPPTSAQASRPTSSINGSKFVPHAPDSSDEDGEGREELVVGFDESGLRRCVFTNNLKSGNPKLTIVFCR